MDHAKNTHYEVCSVVFQRVLQEKSFGVFSRGHSVYELTAVEDELFNALCELGASDYALEYLKISILRRPVDAIENESRSACRPVFVHKPDCFMISPLQTP